MTPEEITTSVGSSRIRMEKAKLNKKYQKTLAKVLTVLARPHYCELFTLISSSAY